MIINGTLISSWIVLNKKMNGKQLIKKLNQHGWQELRIRGSHHQLGKGDLRTTVPVHERDTGVKLL